jgi:hypothetical protein
MDAVNFDQIDAGADDHAVFEATRCRKRPGGGIGCACWSCDATISDRGGAPITFKAIGETGLGSGCFKDGQMPCESCTMLCCASSFR